MQANFCEITCDVFKPKRRSHQSMCKTIVVSDFAGYQNSAIALRQVFYLGYRAINSLPRLW